jgi:L-iditol 2-dehydrogenase
MSKEMKASVMTKVRKIEMQARPIPTPKDDEVLVKIKHVGVCGSDLHFYEKGKLGTNIFADPLVLGHESAGEIVELGKNVKTFKVGDVVALEPGVPCGKCEFCKTGKYNLCADVAFMACPGYDGAFVEYVSWPAEWAFKLPAGMSTIEGALIEPLAVGLHAVNQSEAKLGQSAVILGSGCIGLVTLMSLRLAGISEVYVVDLIQKRLDKAKEIGATKVIKADEADVVKTIMELTDGKGVDLVFETAGSSVTTQQTVELVKRGGTITLVGMSPDSIVPYDISLLIGKEAKLHTIFRYRHLYPVAIKAVAAGLVPLKKIVSHFYKFDDIEEGIEYNVCNKADVIKAVIEF